MVYITIPGNFVMIADSNKCIVMVSEKFWEQIQEEKTILFLHRALFVVLTRRHFCILWDAILQYLYDEMREILRECEKLQKENSGAKEVQFQKISKSINNFALKLSTEASRLYNNFVWRYSTFLTAELGILHTIYQQLDSIFTTSHKMEEIRKEFEELRRQVEFASFFVKEKMAEAMYRPLLEESKKKSNEQNR